MASVLIVLFTLLSYGVGIALGVPLLIPALNTLASYPFMVLALKRGDLRLAVARMLVWAAAMGVAATLIAYARPATADAVFLRGQAYRTEMFAWVMTGQGAESTPSQFIPQQAEHAAIFSALALAAGGAAAMPMGAVLMNYMGHYVGTLAETSAHPALTILLAWHPWAVIRVISFVVIGVVLSAPRCRGSQSSASRRRPRPLPGRRRLVADIILKTLLAPAWQRLLRPSMVMCESCHRRNDHAYISNICMFRQVMIVVSEWNTVESSESLIRQTLIAMLWRSVDSGRFVAF